jgi:hypothetical protein
MDVRQEPAEYICAMWDTWFKLELSMCGHLR